MTQQTQVIISLQGPVGPAGAPGPNEASLIAYVDVTGLGATTVQAAIAALAAQVAELLAGGGGGGGGGQASPELDFSNDNNFGLGLTLGVI